MRRARFTGNFGLFFPYNLDKACVVFLSLVSYWVCGLVAGLKIIWSQTQLSQITYLNNHKEAFLLKMLCCWLSPCNMEELYSLLLSNSIGELHYWPSDISGFPESFFISESHESSGQVSHNPSHICILIIIIICILLAGASVCDSFLL